MNYNGNDKKSITLMLTFKMILNITITTRTANSNEIKGEAAGHQLSGNLTIKMMMTATIYDTMISW